METLSHARALAALGHDARLTVFHLLVRAGEDGLTVGEIRSHTRIAPSTLAHHLRTLVEAGLVTQTRQGREVRTTVAFDAMRATLDFLTSECCAGLGPVADSAA